MLNLFNKKSNKKIPQNESFSNTDLSEKHNLATKEKIGDTRHYPPANKEWINSIYAYNKNYSKTLPVADNIVNRIIRSYFSFSPLNENKKSKLAAIRLKRLSLNKMIVSKSELKHTNDKVIVTLYIYNRNKKFIMYKLKSLYKRLFFFLHKNHSTRKNLSKNNVVSPLSYKQKKQGNIQKITTFNSSLLQGGSQSNVRYNSNNYIYNKPFFMGKKEMNKYNAKNNNYLLALRKFFFLSLVKKTNKVYSKKIYKIKLLKKGSKTTKSYTKNYNHNSILHKKYENFDNIKKQYKVYKGFTNLIENRIKNFVFKIKKISKKNSGVYALKNKYITMLKKHNYAEYLPKQINYINLLKNNVSFGDNVDKDYKVNSRLNIKNNNLALKKSINSKILTYKLLNFYKLINLYNVYNYKSMTFNPVTNMLFPAKETELSSYKTISDTLTEDNIYKIIKQSNVLNASAIEKRKKNINNKNKRVTIKGLKIIKRAERYKAWFFKLFKTNTKLSKENLINYEKEYLNEFFAKVYKKEILYLYFMKTLLFANNKYKNWFLLGLKKTISKIYNKKVEFNLVNLKYLHLNSDIFSESIATKLRNRQNKLLKTLKRSLKLVKLPYTHKLFIYGEKLKTLNKNFINKYKTLNMFSSVLLSRKQTSDVLHKWLQKIYYYRENAKHYDANINLSSPYFNNTNNFGQNPLWRENKVLNSVKYKTIFGIRLETSGRLTRRLTASRSVFKLKYKGSLKNIDSSSKNLSSVILKGNTKPNIQFTKISSKTRNGSFGLKGWVSGH